jgi:hypothetical protein
MMNSLGKICIVLALALLILPAGVMAAAAISTIAAGNTVFLGEEGLDITAAMSGNTRIGWWASAANIYNTAPSYTIMVSNPSSFSVSPSEFSGRLGPWYRINASGVNCPSSGCNAPSSLAFTVADPNLDIRVEDATLGYDATDGWIPLDDEVQFRITTNLYQITQRPGVSAVPIRIYVRSPDGATLSALTNKAGTTTSLMDVPVTSTPYSTGPIWDTGRRDTYPSGTYAIWAECNVNSMNDNYGALGKTVSSNAGMLLQESNPLISVNTRTTAPTTVATSAPTTVKATATTTVPTTVITTTAPPTTLASMTPTAPLTTLMSSPTQTKSPGFEAVLAGAALLLALVWCVRKE